MTHWRKRTLPAIYSWLLGTFTPINEIISGGESVHEAFEKLQGQISSTKTSASGAFAANVYFTAIDSEVEGYKQLSYINDSEETELVAPLTTVETLLRKYLYPDGIGVTSIPAGPWSATYRLKVSSAVGETKLKFEAFVRNLAGEERVLFSQYTDDLENLDFETIIQRMNMPQSDDINTTDRFGVNIYGVTTRQSGVTLTTVVGGVYGSYFNTPLELRHKLLRGTDEDDLHPINSITGLQTSLNNKVSIHKPIEFSTDIEINSSNIDTYNGATLFLTSADENKNITVTEDAGITEIIAVVQCGNATATWVAGANVVVNNGKKTNGIGTATALTKRVAANTFDVIGGVE